MMFIILKINMGKPTVTNIMRKLFGFLIIWFFELNSWGQKDRIGSLIMGIYRTSFGLQDPTSSSRLNYIPE